MALPRALRRWIWWSALLCLTSAEPQEPACPARCSCPKPAKLRCGSAEAPLSELADLDLAPLADYIDNLNLSKNGIKTLSPRLNLPKLQKLDLSNNRLSSIERDAFVNVAALQRLDLSSNLIEHIGKDSFKGLSNLERLLLNGNRLASFADDTFDHLTALKQLDISANPLRCDCDLLWIVDWSKNFNVKLAGNPKCPLPKSLEGESLKKLKTSIDPMTCSTISSPSPNSLLLRPNKNQIVFEGDSLMLKCRAPFQSIKSAYNLTWVSNRDTALINITNVDVMEEGLAESILTVDKLTNNHSGQYTCMYTNFNSSEMYEVIEVVVISNITEYCPTTVTHNNKGAYTWPGGLRGNLISQTCHNKENSFAYYNCEANGTWTGLNTSACPYASETTKMLEQFALIDLSVVKGSVMGACQRLHTLLLQNSPPKAPLQEPDEINFIVQAIDNYMKYVEKEEGLGSVLLDIVNVMINLPQTVLTAAEKLYKSCSNLVSIVENLSKFATNLQGHKKNLAIDQFSITERFTGLTCVWYTMPDLTNSLESDLSRRFHCSTTNRTITPFLAEKDKVIEASVQIPATLLLRVDHQMQPSETGNVHRTYNMIVAMYEKGSFFTKMPPMKDTNQTYINDRIWDFYGGRTPDRQMELAITTPVVGVKLINVTMVHPLAEPIYIMVRDSGVTSGIGGKAVLWDEKENMWIDSPDGCSILRIITNMVVIQCYKLGYVGLMQTVETGMYGGRSAGARFKFSHPAIYVGSIILSMCLLFSMLTYIICYSAIHMATKAKHSLINMWFAMFVLCFMYTLGIYQTEDVQLCQAVGLLIHYLTLSCLLWITVAVSQMYKILSKNQSPSLQSPDEEMPSDVPIQKPILGIYLVGWGISLIICGISGAVNMKHYSSYSHCFLSNAPALSAVFVPSGIILIFISILFLLIRCTIRNINGQLSEGTQATENVDLEMWEPSLLVNNTVDRQSEHSAVDSEMEDTEHTPIVQLRAHAIILGIYIATWCCGCAAIYHPFTFYFPYQEDIFSILYALFAFVLGTFILFFYGIARSDVRGQWLLMQCYLKKRKKCCRTRSVFDAHTQNTSANHHPLAPISNAAAAAQARSRSSSQNSNRTNSKSNNSNILKAAAELNSHNLGEPLNSNSKIPNINLVVLHRQQYRSNNSVITFPENGVNSAEIFYNPNQSNVARKFFKKQRKNVRRNCLDIPRRHNFDSDSQVCSSTFTNESVHGVSNMLSSSSKVNNTNIHVDRDQLSDNGMKEIMNSLNPNILPENEEHLNRSPLKRYVIEKDCMKLQKKMPELKQQNTNAIVMNIYTNIPETKVPQHQIISSVKAKSFDNTPHNPIGTSSSISGEGFDCKGSVENLPTMRTVSQQCSLEYSSTSEVATPLNQLGSDKTLYTHSEMTSLQETHSALCSTHDMTSDTDDTPSFDKYIDFNNPGSLKGTLKKSKQHSCSNLQTVNQDVMTRSLNRSLQDINTIDNPVSLPHDETAVDNIYININELPKKTNVSPMHQFPADSFSSVNKLEYESHCPNFENESDIYFPNYQMSEVSIRSHGLYAPPPTSLCAKDLGVNLSNSEISHTHQDDDCYENQYVNYNPAWKKNPSGSDVRFHSPAVSCPDVNLLDQDGSAHLVSEIDELYKQITIKDRRRKKRSRSPYKSGAKYRNDHHEMRHCESDSCISESHSDILDGDQKAETRV